MNAKLAPLSEGIINEAIRISDRKTRKYTSKSYKIPRGEVGLIFAQIGLASQVLDSSLYSALIAMVVVTTFITPPLLERIFHRST